MTAMRRAPIVVTAMLALSTAIVAADKKPSLKDVMARAHTYVAVYEDHELSGLKARERYQQQLFTGDEQLAAERTLLSDYMLFQLPPLEDWFALRDVHELDGALVADHETRLKMLFTAPRDRIEELAMAIDKESARFNLGTVPRTVNLPTFALRFMRPANRKRFRFWKIAEERIGDSVVWSVGYREVRSPTFSATTEGRDVPAKGRVWIEPETGAVLRTEMVLGGTRRLQQRATVSVTYALDSALGFRVPVEMRERYDNPRKKNQDVILAVASYSEYRPFDSRSLR
jgi:hypothetical protein